MADVFICIELRGEPAGSVYNTLSEFMMDLGWKTRATGDDGVEVPLPHAVYHGSTGADLGKAAAGFREEIEAKVWSSGATVLLMREIAWAQAGNP